MFKMKAKENVMFEIDYLDGLEDILLNGVVKGDRTGTGTLSTFGRLRRYDISDGKVPVLTTKKIFTRSFIHETIWFISGSTNIRYLKENNVSIWDSWVRKGTEEYDKEGNLIAGDIGRGGYGEMWRRREDVRLVNTWELELYEGKGFDYVGAVNQDKEGNTNTHVIRRMIDPLQEMINALRTNPDSRRIIMHAYDTSYTDFAVLPPCHSWVQCWSDPSELANGGKRKLSLLIYLRSNDAPVGEPFNLPQYALLANLIAQCTDHEAAELIYVNGDHHIYLNQVEMVNEQLERDMYSNNARFKINPDITNIDDFKFEDIEIVGYDSFHPSIKYPVSV